MFLTRHRDKASVQPQSTTDPTALSPCHAGKRRTPRCRTGLPQRCTKGWVIQGPVIQVPLVLPFNFRACNAGCVKIVGIDVEDNARNAYATHCLTCFIRRSPVSPISFSKLSNPCVPPSQRARKNATLMHIKPSQPSSVCLIVKRTNFFFQHKVIPVHYRNQAAALKVIILYSSRPKI